VSELPKRELTLLGAAGAVCCAPLVIGAIVAAPVVAVAGGGVALAAGATAIVRRLPRRDSRAWLDDAPNE